MLEFELAKVLPADALDPAAPSEVLARAIRTDLHEVRRLFQGALDRAYLGNDLTSFWGDDDDFD